MATALPVLLPSIGGAGIVELPHLQSTDLGNYGLDSITALPDGKAIVVNSMGIARLMPDGSLDPTFAASGMLVDKLVRITSVTPLADGKLLLGATQATLHASGGPTHDVMAVRLNADGSFDSSFGDGGKAIVAKAGEEELGTAMLQQDGKIVVAGAILEGFDFTQVVMTRLLADGRIDTSYGHGGTATPVTGFSMRKAALQTDGKVVAIGMGDDRTAQWDLVRFNADGTLDMGFGKAGHVHTAFPSGVLAGDVRISAVHDFVFQPDGKIVAVGKIAAESAGHIETMALVRYNSDGSVDPTFGTNGLRQIRITDTFGSVSALSNKAYLSDATSVAIMADGQIVVGGKAEIQAWGETADGAAAVEQSAQFVIVRLNADGSNDKSFGKNGVVTAEIGGQDDSFLAAITPYPDGSIAAAGSVTLIDIATGGGSYTPISKAAVARFDSHGNQDLTLFPSTATESLLYTAPCQAAKALAPGIHLDAPALAAASFKGTAIVLERSSGPHADDAFLPDGPLLFKNGHAVVEGVDIGAVSSANGTLRIDFNDNATAQRVDLALGAITYRNVGPLLEQDTAIALNWTFHQGGADDAQAHMVSNVTLATGRALPYWLDSMLFYPNDGFARGKDDMLAASGPSHSWSVAFTGNGPVLGEIAPHPGTLSAARQAIVWKALAAASAVADVQFKAGQANGADGLRFYDGGGIITQGAVTFNTAVQGKDIALSFTAGAPESTGTVRVGTTLHEIAHALGLKHPFEEGATLDVQENLGTYSVMSNHRAEMPSANPVYAYGDLDIAALQYIYGPSRTARTGNDVYQIKAGAANFIWDGAGADTISAVGVAGDLTLHLAPGHWDYVGSPGTHITSAGQITVNYGTEIENAIGGNGNDHITGNALANRIDGGDGDDVLAGGVGDDTLIGGAGTDTAVLTGKRASYTVDTKTMTVRGVDGTDTLSGIERLQFDDMQVSLDVSGNAAAVFRLYQAAFDRAPDAAGMGYWVASLDKGRTPDDVAAGFVNSREFAQLYGAQPAAKDYITQLYAHVLHRAPDQQGLDWWVDKMNSGAVTLVSALQGFSESAENRAQLVGVLEQGIAYQPWVG